MSLKQMNKSGYYLLYVFMIGLFLGILLVNIKYDVWMQDDGLLNVAMLRKLQGSELDGGYLFGYIMKHRVFTILIIGMLAFTIIGLPIVCGYVCYLGISAGCILSIAVIRYGIRGLFFVAAGIFPQAVLLIPGYFLLFRWGIDCNRKLYKRNDGLEGRYLVGGQFILKKGIGLAGILIIVILGCILESYVNPKIIHFILKILLSA
ncbi:MAG: stage II sporulation protein M [Bacillus sp. (in: Bacteria)]|nr:stage II sporulation protein M [Bacillus sp. (in: firmicutes)]MCM1427362.1 stage II sporulation protein M [Eubacterium sp.]